MSVPSRVGTAALKVRISAVLDLQRWDVLDRYRLGGVGHLFSPAATTGEDLGGARPADRRVQALRARARALRQRPEQVRDPTTWTILQHDGPDHLALWYNALPKHQMALIASGCVPSSMVRLRVKRVEKGGKAHKVMIFKFTGERDSGTPMFEMQVQVTHVLCCS